MCFLLHAVFFCHVCLGIRKHLLQSVKPLCTCGKWTYWLYWHLFMLPCMLPGHCYLCTLFHLLSTCTHVCKKLLLWVFFLFLNLFSQSIISLYWIYWSRSASKHGCAQTAMDIWGSENHWQLVSASYVLFMSALCCVGSIWFSPGMKPLSFWKYGQPHTCLWH